MVGVSLKGLRLIVVFVSLLVAELSYGRCPALGRCFTLPMAVDAAVSPEEAARLRNDLTGRGLDEILKNCKPGPDMRVTEIFGSLCGSGVVSNRICQYAAALDCNYRGKSFDLKVSGACKGGPHDCGTFESCAYDNGINLKDGSFRQSGDAVPKTFNTNPAGAVR